MSLKGSFGLVRLAKKKKETYKPTQERTKRREKESIEATFKVGKPISITYK